MCKLVHLFRLPGLCVPRLLDLNANFSLSSFSVAKLETNFTFMNVCHHESVHSSNTKGHSWWRLQGEKALHALVALTCNVSFVLQIVLDATALVHTLPPVSHLNIASLSVCASGSSNELRLLVMNRNSIWQTASWEPASLLINFVR